jgi:hypothetical protein
VLLSRLTCGVAGLVREVKVVVGCVDKVEGCAFAEGGGVRLPLISLAAGGGFGDFRGCVVGVASEWCLVHKGDCGQLDGSRTPRLWVRALAVGQECFRSYENRDSLT